MLNDKVINLTDYRNCREAELIDDIGAIAFDRLRNETIHADIRTNALINANIDFLLDILFKVEGSEKTREMIMRLEEFIWPGKQRDAKA